MRWWRRHPKCGVRLSPELRRGLATSAGFVMDIRAVPPATAGASHQIIRLKYSSLDFLRQVIFGCRSARARTSLALAAPESAALALTRTSPSGHAPVFSSAAVANAHATPCTLHVVQQPVLLRVPEEGEVPQLKFPDLSRPAILLENRQPRSNPTRRVRVPLEPNISGTGNQKVDTPMPNTPFPNQSQQAIDLQISEGR